MDELRIEYNKIRLIGFLGGFNLAIYAVVVEYLDGRFHPFSGFVPEAPANKLALAFLLINVVIFVFLSSLKFHPMSRKYHLTRNNLTQCFMKKSVLIMALVEIPAILGLVLFLMVGNKLFFYLFFGISIIMDLGFFPRFNHFRKWFESQLQ